MKKILNILLLLGLFANFTIAQGIKFEKGTWAEIKAKAKAENKHIFVDAYTTWCGPCKWQSKKIFPQKKVGDFFNKHFVSFKMDMEKGEGVDFAKKYEIRAFPTLVYFNPQGEIVHKTLGAYPAKKLLKQANNALNPENQFYTMQRRFEKGEKDKAFLKKYIIAAKGARQDFTKPTETYLNQLGKNNWATAEGWEFIKEFVTKYSQEAFGYVLNNQDKFVKLAKNKREVNKFIEKGIEPEMRSISKSKDKDQLTAFKKNLSKILGKSADKYIAKAEYLFYGSDKEKSFHYDCRYLDNYCENPMNFAMTAYSYAFSKDKLDTKRLEKALDWIKRSIELRKIYGNVYVKAQLLFKLERYAEAKKVVEESIVLAKQEKGNIKYAKELLDKINAKL
ncbi:hypothetical protein BKI52_25160 [marine bacterium AO1-C]|nr:hypothetical protein BKI52_25160 [marine bacterium AO1-C]